MRQTRATPSPNDSSAPLTSFSSCHEGILSHLKTFGELPALLEPVARARTIAEDTLKFFREAMFDHHAEEEKDLFPAVLDRAEQGEERENVRKLVDQLKAEHRAIEALWLGMEPQIKKLAKGQPADVDGMAVQSLVRKYAAHAKLEQDQFLPLAERILGRDSTEMAALGLSLHMRHVVRAWHRHGISGS